MLLLLGALSALAGAREVGAAPVVSPLALSPAEQAVVVADAEGALHVVRAGETLPGGGAVLVEVLADRLVVDLVAGDPATAAEGGADAASPVRAWIYPPAAPGRLARLERLDRRPAGDVPADRLVVADPLPERLPEGARVARPEPDRALGEGGGDPSPSPEPEGAGEVQPAGGGAPAAAPPTGPEARAAAAQPEDGR
jgi:hypothetical protein